MFFQLKLFTAIAIWTFSIYLINGFYDSFSSLSLNLHDFFNDENICANFCTCFYGENLCVCLTEGEVLET